MLCLLLAGSCDSVQAHASDASVGQQRISFKRPDGSAGSITLAETHLVYKLDNKAAPGTSAASVQARELVLLSVCITATSSQGS